MDRKSIVDALCGLDLTDDNFEDVNYEYDELDEASTGHLPAIENKEAVRVVGKIFDNHKIPYRVQPGTRGQLAFWPDTDKKPCRAAVTSVKPSAYKSNYRRKDGHVQIFVYAQHADPKDPRSFIALVVFGEEGVQDKEIFFIPTYRVVQPDNRFGVAGDGSEYYIRVDYDHCLEEFGEFRWQKLMINLAKAKKECDPDWVHEPKTRTVNPSNIDNLATGATLKDLSVVQNRAAETDRILKALNINLGSADQNAARYNMPSSVPGVHYQFKLENGKSRFLVELSCELKTKAEAFRDKLADLANNIDEFDYVKKETAQGTEKHFAEFGFEIPLKDPHNVSDAEIAEIRKAYNKLQDFVNE